MKTKIFLMALAATIAFTSNQCENAEEATAEKVTGYNVVVEPTSTDKVGKSITKVKITNKSDDSPATGLNFSITPTMTMTNGMIHTTPSEGASEVGNGVYQIINYYIMPTNNGATNLGSWRLKTYNGSSLLGEPEITVGGMMMHRGMLQGDSDTAKSGMMMASEKRKYFIFIEEVTANGGDHDVKVFVGTRETLLNHPAVATGSSLTNGTGNSNTVTDVSLQIASSSGGTFKSATEAGSKGGHYIATAVTGFTAGTQNVFAKLAVDLGSGSEVKTTDGNAAGANIESTIQGVTIP